ncbi:hypothetical protein [Pseudooceanicola sp.]|uniref:hypothetical protein n=1 Tax=Pseudooceanicola sp. TaxID=1914328 RepID=UPI0026105BD2|nr:hypothetical protein [Pseudooceanicola sp.]MDF1854694.1 hypothetical protein [Pseudooceanicola sp.]
MYDLMLFVHFAALALGGAATFGSPLLALQIARTPVDQRTTILPLVPVIQKTGRAAIGLLIFSGAALAGLGDLWDKSAWFWGKLLLVALLVLSIVVATRAARAGAAGDAAAAARARLLGRSNIALLLLIILGAVLAFH